MSPASLCDILRECYSNAPFIDSPQEDPFTHLSEAPAENPVVLKVFVVVQIVNKINETTPGAQVPIKVSLCLCMVLSKGCRMLQQH